MLFRQLFDHDSWTYSYLLADEKTREAVLIDPVDVRWTTRFAYWRSCS
ncbi:MAG: hypothetical protein R3E61_10285 [Pseudomonadales bacterium]